MTVPLEMYVLRSLKFRLPVKDGRIKVVHRDVVVLHDRRRNGVVGRNIIETAAGRLELCGDWGSGRPEPALNGFMTLPPVVADKSPSRRLCTRVADVFFKRSVQSPK